MDSTQAHIHYYSSLGMPPREISDTLGIPLKRVYRNLNNSDMGRRTLHYFPNMDTSLPQLNTAEDNRAFVVDKFWPCKETRYAL
jgi:hypothetical protein